MLLLGGPFLLALGTDEAWILASMRAVATDQTPWAVRPTLTSGGPFALIHGLLFEAGVTTLVVHRLVTVLCAVGSLILTVRLLPKESRQGDGKLYLAAGLVAAPGALLMAGLAHAEWMASMFAIASVVAWVHTVGQPATRILGAGVLLGLCAASRAPALALFPAWLGWAALGSEGRGRRMRDALGVVLVACAVLAMATALYRSLGPTVLTSEPPHALQALGLRGWVPDYPRVMNRWLVGERILPLAWLATVTAAALAWGVRRSEPLPAWTLLLAFAWANWGAWMLRTPIPHLRYLWPGLAAFGAVVGLTLAAMHRHASSRNQPLGRVACLALALAIVAGPLVTGFRQLMNGHTDLVMWEWSGESELTYTRRFQHALDQRVAARWLQERLGEHDDVVVFSQPHPLRYLSGRKVRALWDYVDEAGLHWTREDRPGWIVMQPYNHAYRFLRPEAQAWLREATHLEAEFGSYAIYRVLEPWPEDPRDFRLWARREVRFPHAQPRFGTSE